MLYKYVLFNESILITIKRSWKSSIVNQLFEIYFDFFAKKYRL